MATSGYFHMAMRILMVLGRVNRDLWWGDWILVAGFVVLVVAGALTLRARR